MPAETSRNFGTIVEIEPLREWEVREPVKGSQLEGLSLIGGTSVQEAVRELSQSGILHIQELKQGLRIKTTSFAGRIQLGNLAITVLPKIQGMPLISLLRYAYGLRDLKLSSPTEQWIGRFAFQDLLLEQLLAEVEELIARGLVRNYQRTEERLSSPRGKINIQRLVREGGQTDPSLPCVHHPRPNNWLLNQVLLSGVRFGSQLANDSLLKVRLRRLATLLDDDVTEIHLDSQILRQAERQISRLTFSYKPSLSIISMLLFGQGVVLEATSLPQSVCGFVFDMNLFFQNLLLRFLREHLSPERVEAQFPLTGMFVFVDAHPDRKTRISSPRPDFAIIRNSKVQMLLDAKYRDIRSDAPPSSWLYQVGMYALSQKPASQATILYPTISREAGEGRIDIHHPKTQKHLASVHLRPVDMQGLADLVTRPITHAKRRTAASLARWLALGEQCQSLPAKGM